MKVTRSLGFGEGNGDAKRKRGLIHTEGWALRESRKGVGRIMKEGPVDVA